MTELIFLINNRVNEFVWGPVTLFVLLGLGLYITVQTGFFQFANAKDIAINTIVSIFKGDIKSTDSGNVSPYQAMTAAVASSVGVGSIAGVSTAIVAGGPGAIFWMWMSALVGMMTKYAEVVLAIHFREKDENGIHYGGPMYYIEKGLSCKPLAIAFATFTGISCFNIGNMTQANSIAASLHSAFNLPPSFTGVMLASLSAVVIFGGVTRITRVSEKLVPVMAVFYIIGSLIVIIQNASLVPGVVALIFQEAFSLKSAGSGALGYGVFLAMRFGVARGVFSNEAGLGSAPIMHAAANTDSPVRQGMWGIFEVFVTTICICSMTALVVLTSDVLKTGHSGAVLVSTAFSKTFGAYGSAFVAIAIFFFAFSTMIGWAYYGECSWGYIFSNHKPLVSRVIRIIWLPVVFIGSVSELDLVWGIADTFNGLMMIPNIVALFCLSGIVFKLTREYIAAR
jgi:AGCS family alanine or glycine:cation symporter